MSWEKKKKQEIKKDLKNKDWNINNFTKENFIYANKKFFWFFNRYYLYYIKKKISLSELKKIKKEIDEKNIKYHGLWLAIKEINDKIIKYAKENNIGIIEMES